MIVHAYYEEDPRVRREAESLAASGRPVLVLGLRRPELPAEEVLQGVHVRRLDESSATRAPGSERTSASTCPS